MVFHAPRLTGEGGLARPESDTRWRTTFATAAVGMALVDPAGRFLQANEAFCRIAGYSEPELLATDFQSITHPDDVARCVTVLRQMLAGEVSSAVLDKRYVRPGGEVVWAQTSVASALDVRGAPHFVALVQDVSRGRAAEDALVASERRFRAVFDGAQDAMLISDDRGRYVEANDAACALFGRSRAQILAAGVGGLSAPGLDVRRVWRELKRAGRATGRWWIARPDGTTREVEYALTRDVLPGLHLNVVRDLAARNAVEAELGREREILKAIVDNIPVMLMIWDREGNVEWINREFQRLRGWCLEDARQPDFLCRAYPDAAEREAALRHLRVGPGWRDFRSVAKDGRLLHIAWANAGLSDGRTLGIGQDVTERKRTEREIERRAGQLQALADAAVKIGAAASIPEITAVATEAAFDILGARGPVPSFTVDEIVRLAHKRERDGDADAAILVQLAQLAAQAVENARLLEEVSAARARLEALSRRLVSLQEEERLAIARGLHDEVGQLLTGLRLMMEDENPTPRKRAEKHQVVNEIIGRVRDLSMNLRPPMLDVLGLLPTLFWQIERFEAQTAIQVRFQYANLDRRFDPALELTAFRVVQEALTNVARHAGVDHVKVEVWAHGASLGARVEDEGRGFAVGPALAGHSSGLAGMLERSRLLGGTLSIESEPGAGTRLALELPLARPEKGA